MYGNNRTSIFKLIMIKDNPSLTYGTLVITRRGQSIVSIADDNRLQLYLALIYTWVFSQKCDKKLGDLTHWVLTKPIIWSWVKSIQSMPIDIDRYSSILIDSQSTSIDIFNRYRMDYFSTIGYRLKIDWHRLLSIFIDWFSVSILSIDHALY